MTDQGTIKFTIRAAVQLDKDLFLRSNYSANADIVLDKREDVLAINEGNLVIEGDKTFVEVETAPQQFEKREIKTGLSDGINIEVVSGLKAGRQDQASLVCRSRPPPRGGTVSHHAAKQPRQVRLVRQAAFRGDVAQRHVGREHELAGMVHAPPDQELVRGFAHAVAEGDREMKLAELHERGQITVSDGRREPGFDVVLHLFHLPGQQPRSGIRGAGRHRLKGGFQGGFRAPQIHRRVAAVVAQRLVQCPGNVLDGGLQLMQRQRHRAALFLVGGVHGFLSCAGRRAGPR